MHIIKNTSLLALCAGLFLTGCTPIFQKSNMSPEQAKPICMGLKQDINLNDQVNRGPSMQGTSTTKSAMLYRQYNYYNCDEALGVTDTD